MELVLSTAAALISAFIGFAIWHLERKLDRMEQESQSRDREQIELRSAERELLYAEAKISALTARVARGEIVNGDLEAAEKLLLEKKTALSDLTNKIIAEFMEG